MPKMWALCHSVWLLAYFSKLYTTVLCLFPVNRLLLYSISMQFASGGGGAVAQERKREGWENKASMVLSPAGPCRAAVAGASYVMWLAGPTSLFRAAAHTNPHWGTSPALEKEEEIEGEFVREPVEEVWLQEFFPFICTKSNTQTSPLSAPLLKDKRIISALLTAGYSIDWDRSHAVKTRSHHLGIFLMTNLSVV